MSRLTLGCALAGIPSAVLLFLFFRGIPAGVPPWLVAGAGKVAEELFTLFFQAEAGIRDLAVTGVQTCALPISRHHEGSRTVLVVHGMGGRGDAAFRSESWGDRRESNPRFRGHIPPACHWTTPP